MTEATTNGQASKPKPAAKKRAATNDATLAEVAVAFLANMVKQGRRETSVCAYEKDLELAVEVLGKDTPLSKITPAQVAEFYEHPLVMTTKTGRPKSEPTYARTRRVFRLAVTWAEGEGMIANAPLPEPTAKPKAEPAAEPKKPARKKRSSKAAAKKEEPATDDAPTTN